ncbi:MAG: hypothetical protein ACI8TP_000358 [Acidimicrobiales bacterium]|jgi:hypothetical protein
MLVWSDRWQPYLAARDLGSPGRVIRHDGFAVLVGTENGMKQLPIRPSTPG